MSMLRDFNRKTHAPTSFMMQYYWAHGISSGGG